MEKVTLVQNKHFPPSLKIVMFIFAIFHCLFFLLLFSTQLIHVASYQHILNNNCDVTFNSTEEHKNKYRNIYSDNCKVKIPFCRSSFIPNCGCAALSIENDKSLTQMPIQIITEMKDLKLLRVLNCNLTDIPQEIEQLTQLVSVDFAYNKLTSFNINILKWKYIMHLNLKFNNISKYHQHALWNHPVLAALWVNSNPYFRMPDNEAKVYSPSLYYLVITNNSLILPNNFGKEQVPQLNFFYAGGNILSSNYGNNDVNSQFPKNFETLYDKIVHLDISRSNLIGLPSYISKFYNLLYIDARNNKISSVDNNFRNLILSKRIYNRALFSFNPICNNNNNSATPTSSVRNNNDEAINCKEMCSIYCNYESWQKDELYPHGDGFCDPRCNSKMCDYDGYDCVDNLIEP
jgi:Leucine-rich repeat (LRR) protein